MDNDKHKAGCRYSGVVPVSHCPCGCGVSDELPTQEEFENMKPLDMGDVKRRMLGVKARLSGSAILEQMQATLRPEIGRAKKLLSDEEFKKLFAPSVKDSLNSFPEGFVRRILADDYDPRKDPNAFAVPNSHPIFDGERVTADEVIRVRNEMDGVLPQEHSLLGVDRAKEGYADHTVMALMVNTTTFANDKSVQKHAHLAEQLMTSLFAELPFKDNFEIERFVSSLASASRSHGSAAMIRLQDKKRRGH